VIQVDGKAFLADLRALEADLHKETAEAMKHAVEEAERNAKTTMLFKDRTGTLRNEITSWATTTHGELSANAPYARFVESGTVPHRITPRGAYPLRFYWEKVGTHVEFWSVNHPGTKAMPFMERAGEWGGAVLYDGLSAFTQDAISRFNGK
jgi:hypothetical protein